MFRPTENFLSASTADQSMMHVANSQIFAKEPEPSFDRDDRAQHHADRRNRGSYYVFRQGTLQMQSFDRQTIGW